MELALIIVIAAIIAAVVIPRLGNPTGMQLKAAAKKVASDIRYAQSIAMTNRTAMWTRITFDASNNSYRIYSRGGNVKNPVTQESAFHVLLNQGGYQGIAVQNNFSTTFNYPLGNPSPDSQPDYIALAIGTAFQNISVTPFTGKVVVK